MDLIYAVTNTEPKRLLRFFHTAHRAQLKHRCTPITAAEAHKLKLATKWRIHSNLSAKGFAYLSAEIEGDYHDAH